MNTQETQTKPTTMRVTFERTDEEAVHSVYLVTANVQASNLDEAREAVRSGDYEEADISDRLRVTLCPYDLDDATREPHLETVALATDTPAEPKTMTVYYVTENCEYAAQPTVFIYLDRDQWLTRIRDTMADALGYGHVSFPDSDSQHAWQTSTSPAEEVAVLDQTDMCWDNWRGHGISWGSREVQG